MADLYLGGPGVPTVTREATQPSSVSGSFIYNDIGVTYNRAMRSNTHVMTVSRNGQVSIPADTRARWNVRRVLVIDLGDRVVMRPLGERPIEDLDGKYRGRGPSTDRARKQARAEDAAHARAC